MKRAVLILLSISMVFILSGFAFAAAGGLMTDHIRFDGNDDKYEQLSERQSSEKTEDAQKCTAIDLELVNTNLDVVKYDGNVIKLDYDYIYKDEWAYGLDGSTMRLRNVKYHNFSSVVKSFYSFLDSLKSGNWNLNLDLDFNDNDNHSSNALMHTVKLYIPASSKEALKISNVNGGITVSDVTVKNMNISLVNSSFTANNVVSTDAVKVTDVNGSISMKNVTAPQLKMPSVLNAQCVIDTPKFDDISVDSLLNGALKLTSVDNPEDYSVNYSLVNGSAKIGDSSYSGNGNYSGGDAKYNVKFNGVNSSLYITK